MTAHEANQPLHHATPPHPTLLGRVTDGKPRPSRIGPIAGRLHRGVMATVARLGLPNSIAVEMAGCLFGTLDIASDPYHRAPVPRPFAAARGVSPGWKPCRRAHMAYL